MLTEGMLSTGVMSDTEEHSVAWITEYQQASRSAALGSAHTIPGPIPNRIGDLCYQQTVGAAVARLPDTEEATGSIPVRSTTARPRQTVGALPVPDGGHRPRLLAGCFVHLDARAQQPQLGGQLGAAIVNACRSSRG